jgi:hypothetical protein
MSFAFRAVLNLVCGRARVYSDRMECKKVRGFSPGADFPQRLKAGMLLRLYGTADAVP